VGQRKRRASNRQPSAALANNATTPLPNNSGRGLAEGLVQLRRGKEARWVDPLAESARYEQLLTEGFTAAA
jgi:hypothetical protein